MNVTELFNKVLDKELTRADLDDSKLSPGTKYLVIAFPYFNYRMVQKIQNWGVANKYQCEEWSVSAGQTGELVILSMTLEAVE